VPKCGILASLRLKITEGRREVASPRDNLEAKWRKVGLAPVEYGNEAATWDCLAPFLSRFAPPEALNDA
jgi:hypothetical protein